MSPASQAYVDLQVEACRRFFRNIGFDGEAAERNLGELRGKLELYVAENAR